MQIRRIPQTLGTWRLLRAAPDSRVPPREGGTGGRAEPSCRSGWTKTTVNGIRGSRLWWWVNPHEPSSHPTARQPGAVPQTHKTQSAPAASRHVQKQQETSGQKTTSLLVATRMEVSEGDASALWTDNCSSSTRQAPSPNATSCPQRNIVSVLERQFYAADSPNPFSCNRLWRFLHTSKATMNG